MIARVEQADGSYKPIEMGNPVCGEDFCDGCGDCLHCYGDYCNGGCDWVIYIGDSKHPDSPN